MAPSALYMIHNVSGGSSGDYRDLSHTSNVLRTASEAISNAYQQKTGKSEKELLSLMDDETWLNAKQAKENGFIDEIIGESVIDDDGVKTTLVNSFCTLLPDETIQKVRNMVKNPQGSSEDDSNADFLMRKNTALANLRLLELEGRK